MLAKIQYTLKKKKKKNLKIGGGLSGNQDCSKYDFILY